jgi:hypothetical protein
MTDDQHERDAIDQYVNEGCPNFDRETIDPGEGVPPTDCPDHF